MGDEISALHDFRDDSHDEISALHDFRDYFRDEISALHVRFVWLCGQFATRHADRVNAICRKNAPRVHCTRPAAAGTATYIFIFSM